MTLLTWRQGEQMVGFSLAHTMPGFLLLGFLAGFAAAVWCIAVLALAVLKKRTLAPLDWALTAATVLTVLAPSIPYPAWRWVTSSALGAGRPFPPAVAERKYVELTDAAAAGRLSDLAELLRRGLKVDGVDEFGKTALYAAASSGRSQAVTYLLRKGAQVNLENKAGETALHAAACYGHADVVKLLIAAGADPTLRTDGGKGFTAADLAWPDHPDVAAMLENAR